MRFPLTHYAGHDCYVPQLYREELAYFDARKNPAFQVCDVRLFLAVRHDTVVGRICGLVNRLESEKLGYRRGRFGWFESIDDRAVAHGLLDAVRDWHRESGCAEMTGPHGFTDLDIEGLLVEGFDAIPTVAGAYNHPYYEALLDSYGLIKDVDYLDFRFGVPERPTFLERLGKRATESGGYTIRPVPDKKTFRAYVQQLWPVLERAFAPLYGVTPLTEKQQVYYTRKYFGFLDPEFFVFIFSPDDELVAFLAAMPNISHGLQRARGRMFPTGIFHVLRDLKNPDTVDFLLAGALPEHPTSQLTALGLDHMFRVLRARGVKHVEGNHQLEDNKSIYQMWERFGIENRRRSRVYRLPLT